MSLQASCGKCGAYIDRLGYCDRCAMRYRREVEGCAAHVDPRDDRIATLERQLAERTRERDRAIAEARAFFDEHAAVVARAESAEQRERELREALAELLAADYAIKGDIVSDDYYAMALRWSRAKDAARAALAPAQQEKGEQT